MLLRSDKDRVGNVEIRRRMGIDTDVIEMVDGKILKWYMQRMLAE